ncbi:MAG: biosynthetic-type acetolactate synthase large subunit [Candidatus Theseobacter exili]|nr:biosynthetic-type acetolactate synthase large subunit [Candidatus Theseobacter exili]
MSMTGAAMVIECFKKEKVEVLFGYPGGTVIDIFDELTKSKVQFFLTRHEQGAIHAADGYARSTGKIGVCIATSGPGATNLVTGLATASMDSIPIVAITGQVSTAMIGNDAFQEADVTGITRPVTKHNYLVKDANELPRILKEAFYIAFSGRPGPVVIDIPKNVQQSIIDLPYPDSVAIRSYKPTYEGHIRQIKKVASAISASKKPLIYSGGGVIISGASNELTELARKARIPVTTTLMGLGAFPETDELSVEMLGMHGTAYANFAVQETDLLIAIGARFDDRITGTLSTFAPHAKVIHIDIDPTAIRKNVKVDIPVVGDVKKVLKVLNTMIEPADSSDWLKHISALKKKNPLSYKKSKTVIKPQEVVEEIYDLTGGDAIVCTEVGQNQMWAAQFFKYSKPRTFLSSGGLGTMGYGFPAAIGAQIGNPGKLVFDIAGDGSIQMNIQELATAVINDLPVKVIILNNGYLGMVRQWQELFYEKRYSGTCLSRGKVCPKGCDGRPNDKCPANYIPDFVKVAEAYGAIGKRVVKPGDLRPVLKEIIKVKKPVFLDVKVSPEENVFPMVPAGASLNQMIGGLA